MQDLVGFILPPVIDLINRKVANAILRFWIAMAVCVLVGVIVHINELNNLENILGSIGVIFAESQIVYKTYWANSGVRDSLYPKRASE
jgi:hypothetical protein